MNNHIFNTQPKHLLMAGYGKSVPDGFLTPIATDQDGRMILSSSLDIDTQANGLDIRPLSETYDNVSFSISNTDIRDLTGQRDNVLVNSQSFAEAQDSGAIVALSTRYFLPRDLSPYRRNTFYVRNTSALSISVSINLQIAPVNVDSYYINDSSSYNLVGGSTLVLEPTRLMRYARVRVSAVLLANVIVYYFGQT